MSDDMVRLRQGRKVGRTIYQVTGDDPDQDRLVGMVDAPGLAATICAAVNGHANTVAAQDLPETVLVLARQAYFDAYIAATTRGESSEMVAGVDAAVRVAYTAGLAVVSGGSGQSEPIPTARPTVVTLCGSTRFKEQFIDAAATETMAGKVVLSVGLFGHADQVPLTVEQKTMLDALHLDKISMSDEILVVSDDTGYYGDSTRREIAFAEAHSIPVRYLVPPQ